MRNLVIWRHSSAADLAATLFPLSYLLILTTASSRREADSLADFLLKKRLAACINISSPVISHYLWKGKKERAKEFILFIKTKASCYKKLEKALAAEHSYSVPEVIALPFKTGSRKYLKWIAEQTY